MPTCDFSGWATRNDLLCADGRTIRKDAFKEDDGRVVPLVWNHQHGAVDNVLGHALLENRENGVYAYCSFNDTDSGKAAKRLVDHGDVTRLSIWANKLQQKGGDVLHGVIREVSLVLAGANPGASIDFVMGHNEDGEDGVIISLGEADAELSFAHAATEDKKEEQPVAESEKKTESEKTIGDVFETLNEEQKKVVYYMIGQALEDNKSDTEEDDESMKHNVFEDGENVRDTVLSHSDMQKIFADAKRIGSLKEAVAQNLEDGVLVHSIDTTGMETATGTQTYGFNDASMLFPEARSLNNPPEWIKRDTGWVSKVMSGVHHTPFSRIKSTYANITEDDARAKGYIKGHQKKEEVFTTLKRTTTPQTIYKKQKLDRDDIIDITDFDGVAWIRAEMRVMLDEEIARAILIGDGRPGDSEDKINELNIRPIVNDVPLFNVRKAVTVAAAADEATIAKATINAAIRARKDYKGSGNPTFYTTEDVVTEMLLLEDEIGHKLYKTMGELATALRAREIVTVEPMENQTITVSGVAKPLIGVFVNLADYNVGRDRGGEVNMFDDFDIDFNQYKYLIETRMSGALIKPYSAITMYLDQAN